MKEAAGEANITVITIVLIAIVLAVGTVIVKGLLENTKRSSACSACGGSWRNGACYSGNTDSRISIGTCLNRINEAG